MLEYTRQGIYISDTGIMPKPGLWLLDPLTGKVRLVPGTFEELPIPAGLEVWSSHQAEPGLWLPLRWGKGVALYTREHGVQVFKTETGPYSFTLAGGCFDPARWIPKQADASWRALGG